MKSEDFVDQLLVANTHDTVLCFSSRGKVYWIRVFELPQASRAARGSPIVNLLPLGDGERITTILPLNDFQQDGFVLMATARGLIKKTALSAYSRPRSTGLIAVELLPDDTLVGVAVTDGQQHLMLASNNGKSVRFDESQVRAMGRAARGVIGMRLSPDDRVISAHERESRDGVDGNREWFWEMYPSVRVPGEGARHKRRHLNPNLDPQRRSGCRTIGECER